MNHFTVPWSIYWSPFRVPGHPTNKGHPSHIGWRTVCCKPTLTCHPSITEIVGEAHVAGNPGAGARPARSLCKYFVTLKTSDSSLMKLQASLPMLQTCIYGGSGEKSERGFVHVVRGAPASF